MRIGFDAKRLFNNVSGLGNYARNLVKVLDKFKQHEELVLYSPKSSKQFEQFESDFETHFPKLLKPFWRQFGIVRQLESDKIDVYHGLSAELPYFKNDSIGKIVTIHDVIFDRYPDYYSYFDRLIYRQKTKSAINQADKVVAISEVTKSDLIELYGMPPDKCVVIPVICDSFFTEKPNKGTIYSVQSKYSIRGKFIFCLSKFEKRKNQLRLVKAFHKVQAKLGVVLVLAGGKGDLLDEVQNYIAKNDLDNYVQVIISPTNEEIKALYYSCEHFVFPSEYEGFGMPVLEAMMCGKIAITSKGTSMEEIALDSGIYFTSDSIESISDALMRIQNTDLLAQKHAQRLKRVISYGEIEIARKYLTEYRLLKGAMHR